jgi:hypothetical protein
MEDLTTYSLGPSGPDYSLFECDNQLYLREHPDGGYTPVERSKAIRWAQERVDASAGPGAWEVVSITCGDDEIVAHVRDGTEAKPTISSVLADLNERWSGMRPLVLEAEEKAGDASSYAMDANAAANSAEYAADEAGNLLDRIKDKIDDIELRIDQLNELMDPS